MQNNAGQIRIFEKARVEAVFLDSQGDKESQFMSWNESEYKQIKDKIDKAVDQKYSGEIQDKINKEIKPKIRNRFFNKIPDNSFIVTLINYQNESYGKFSLCYPFFSSHLMLPVKPGEIVWVFKYHYEFQERTNKIESHQSEPFINKCYWLSRVHGENFSEDLNYTHHDRAFMSLFPNKILEDYKIPDFKDHKTTNPNSLPGMKEGITENLIKHNNVAVDVSSKTNKLPGDFLVQGSNNNLIKMSSDVKKDGSMAGNITLVAGKGKLFYQKDRYKYEKNNAGEEYKIWQHDNMPGSSVSIKNKSGFRERLKNPEIYNFDIMGKSKYLTTAAEGDLNYTSDASFIDIQENSSNNKYTDLYNSDLKNIQGKSSNRIRLINNIAKITDNSPSKEFYNFEKTSYDNNKDSPSIIAKSTDITIVARKKEPGYSQSGKICLVKDADDYKNYGHIIIDKDGQIGIDGSKIVIGNSSRLNEQSNDLGGIIQLGQSDDMEPVVKGQHLVITLEHIIGEVNRAFTYISKAFEELQNHVHIATSLGSPTAIPLKQDQSPLLDLKDATTKLKSATPPEKENQEKSTSNSEVQKELFEITKNLDKLLSKLVKTS